MIKDHQDPLVPFPSESSADVLTDVLRDGARRMLATAIEGEVEAYVAARTSLVDAEGR